MLETNKDELLLEQAKIGDQDAFLGLYQRHRDPIFGFLYRLLGSAAIAEDIAHDCFLSLIGVPERSRSLAMAPVRTRLYSIARNLAIEYFRNSGQQPVVKDFVKDDAISRGIGQTTRHTIESWLQQWEKLWLVCHFSNVKPLYFMNTKV